MGKKIIVGDIWKQKGFKVVSTNLGGVHGRGLAAQAKQKGLITRFNKSFATSPKNSDVITLAVKGNAPETARINVGGKPQAYSEQTSGKNVELLKSEVNELIKFARKNPTKNINLPFIGLGFGEGNPDDILPILREAAKEPNIYLVTKDQKTVEKYKDTFKAGVRSDRSLMGKRIKIKVISGGQVGADRLGLEEAKKLGFETGGTAPLKYQTTVVNKVMQYDPSLKDFGVTEIDPKLELAYKKKTGKSNPYGARTEQNVLKSDITLLYTVEGRENSPGSKLTRDLAKEHNKPYLQNPTKEQISSAVANLGKENVTINIAGNREYGRGGTEILARKHISEGLKAASGASPVPAQLAKPQLAKTLSKASTTLSKKYRKLLPSEIKDKKLKNPKPEAILSSEGKIIGYKGTQKVKPKPAVVPPKYKVLPYDLRKFFSSEGKPTRIYTKGKKKGGKIISLKDPNLKDPNKKKIKTSKSFNFKKGIWIQGSHKVTDRAGIIKTLDQIWSDTGKSMKKGNFKVYYGGYKASQTDQIIAEWAEKNKVPIMKIDPKDKTIFDPKKGYKVYGSKDWQKELDQRADALDRWQKQGSIVNQYSLSPKGEIKYSSKYRTKWRNTLKELTDKYGKGQTRKVHEAFLDMIEDEMYGESRQSASEKKFIQQEGVRKNTGSKLDEGQTRVTLKKANIDSALAGIEVLEDRNEIINAQRRAKFIEGIEDIVQEKDINIKEWLTDISKKRIANIRGEESNPLRYGQSITTDYPDQPGVPEGKDYIETERVGTYEKVGTEKSPELFEDKSRYMWGVDVGKLERGKIKKGVKVHDTNKPAMKAPIVQQLISDVVNIDPVEMGYTGQNVFGDFFKKDVQQVKTQQDYDARDSNKQVIEDVTDEFGEGAEVHKDKHLQRQKIADKKEIHALDKLLRKMPKDLDLLPEAEKLKWERTLLTELMNIPDSHAKDQVTVLDAPYSHQKKTPSGEHKREGKVLGEKPKYRTQSEIKDALPAELVEENEWKQKQLKKYPEQPIYGKEGKLRGKVETHFKVRKHSDESYDKAYVSDPSKASASDVRKHISTKKPLPKGLAGSVAKWLGRFSLVLAPILGYSSLKSKKAEASVKNIAQETASVLIGSERVFGSVGNKGYFQNVGLTKKGLSGKRRPGGPIKGAGGQDTPYAKIMKYFTPVSDNAWKNRKRVRRN
tara:strand:- start:5738 stop:9289 length:3552 start_codon:yes stop_codon:yes gene_type:complete